MNTRRRAKSIRDAATLQENNTTLYVEKKSLDGAVKEDILKLYNPHEHESLHYHLQIYHKVVENRSEQDQ